jgi:hypothetical protein
VSGKLAERINCGRRPVARIPPGLDARDANLGIASATPVNQQNGFVGGVVEFTHDFLNQNMDEPLLGSRLR